MTWVTEAGLRERKQEKQRSELVAVGMRLFASQGFDATTVDEIAEAAGVSRRTLFRYFGTKGDIVMQWARGTTTVLTAALRARPPSEEPLRSLHAAFIEMCGSFTGSPQELRATSMMIEHTASLRPFSLLKHARWEDALAAVLGERSPDSGELRCALLARISVAAFRSALDEWLRLGDHSSPLQHLDRAFDIIRRELN